jgi:hypothetical protein
MAEWTASVVAAPRAPEAPETRLDRIREQYLNRLRLR